MLPRPTDLLLLCSQTQGTRAAEGVASLSELCAEFWHHEGPRERSLYPGQSLAKCSGSCGSLHLPEKQKLLPGFFPSSSIERLPLALRKGWEISRGRWTGNEKKYKSICSDHP